MRAPSNRQEYTRFIVITTCFNVRPWIESNLRASAMQSHQSALFVYVDDGSTDGTFEELQRFAAANDSRFMVLRSDDISQRGSQGKAFLYAWNYLNQKGYIQPEDVIVEVDGDDWLFDERSLAYVAELYQNPHQVVWMTYGQYQKWPSGELGGHFNMSLVDLVDWDNDYRRHPFPFSHLKTYKAWLLNKVDQRDLIDPRTGEPFSAAWDHALCLPMVEMAGKARIARASHVLYSLNRSPLLNNEGSTRLEYQKGTEQIIRSKRKYSRLAE